MSNNMTESEATLRMFAIEQAKVNEVRALLYEDDDDVRSTKDTFKHKLNRILIEFTALLCLVDFMAFEPYNRTRGQSGRIATLRLRMFNKSINIPLFSYKSIPVSDWGREARRKLWPYLVPLFWLASVSHLSYLSYLQYAYDYYVFRLSRVRWLNRTQVLGFNGGKLEREDFLLDILREKSDYLEQIGAPNIHLTFIAEMAHISHMYNSFVLYILPFIYFKCFTPFDFYLLRNLYNYGEEQRRNRQFVQLEVGEFIHSIKNWSQSLFNSCVPTKDDKFVSPGGARLIDCATVEESLLCKQLEEMLLAGHLRPLNQRPRWVECWRKYYNCFVILCYVYAIFLELLAYLLRDKYRLDYKNGANLGKWLIFVEAKFWMFVNHATLSLYGAALWFTCRDQIMLVNKLRKLLSLTLELNSSHFYGRHHHHHLLIDHEYESSQWFLTVANNENDTRRSKWGRHTKSQLIQMNRDILLFLMHYRLFVAQLDRLKPSLSIIAARSALLMLFTPILGRIFVPYLVIDTMPATRQLIFLSSCIVVVFYNIYLIPICYLNKRCVDLYADLNSLLAHLTQINLNISDSEALENHDRHILISLLRKELCHHDQAMRRFSIKSLGLNFTYENLITLHVYIGILLLSVMGENLAQIKEPTGTIFTDPLGLF